MSFDSIAYNRDYLRGYNATRRHALRTAGLCVDCTSPSNGYRRCESCRHVQSTKEKAKRECRK